MSEQPVPATPEKPKRNWTKTILIVVGVLTALCCVVVVLYFVVLAPAVAKVNLQIVCAIVQSSGDTDAASEKCKAWIADLEKNHPQELQACQQANSSEGDLYNCLLQQGLGPK